MTNWPPSDLPRPFWVMSHSMAQKNSWKSMKEIMMQEINKTCYVIFHLRRNTTNFHVKTEDGQKNNHGDLDDTVIKPVTTFTTTDNRLISAVHNNKTQKPKAVRWVWLQHDRSDRSVTVRGVPQSFALGQAKQGSGDRCENASWVTQGECDKCRGDDATWLMGLRSV